jgi:hypothetical protein
MRYFPVGHQLINLHNHFEEYLNKRIGTNRNQMWEVARQKEKAERT